MVIKICLLQLMVLRFYILVLVLKIAYLGQFLCLITVILDTLIKKKTCLVRTHEKG